MNIGIICVGWAFMYDLLKELKKYHTVSILRAPFTAKRVESFMRKLDVLYVEWCASYMAAVTNVPKHCPIVNRLHRMEVHGRWMKNVDFPKIDRLILVNEFVKNYCFKYQPKLKNVKEIKVVKHGVDIDKFNYNLKRGYGKRLGWVGNLKPVKDPMRVLKLMPQIPDWQLRFLAIPSVYHNLITTTEKMVGSRRNVVWIRKKIPHSKMPTYYQKLDVYVNTSLLESQCVSVLEAMSCGIYSLIRKWPHPQCRAEEIYPQDLLFDTMVECKRKIWSWVKLSFDEKRVVSQRMRSFVVKRHNVKDNVRLMRKMIEGVVK